MADARYRRRSSYDAGLAAGQPSIEAALAAFGRAVARKLGRGGNAEDQLRGPVELLFQQVGSNLGVDTVPYGEVSLKTLRARPDYAVDVVDSRVGYVELKSPDRDVPPKWRPDKREREQWEKLCALPNVIYTNGTTWAHFEYGELKQPVVHLAGDIHDRRGCLRAEDSGFEQMLNDFLLWAPDRPRSLRQLIKIVAGLCRLLQGDVEAILRGSPEHAAFEDLTLLAADWRDLLFPDLDDTGFADAYAQTIVYAMLLARVDGIEFGGSSLHEIARQLGKKHSLMGKAFTVLIDGEATEELRTIETLRRVIGAVEWSQLDDGQSDVYAELYERFLAEYNPDLRKRSGSYYTPRRVAAAMVDFVEQVLRTRLGKSWGLASDDVVVVDPAMGTGTFLVEILRSVAETVDEKQGPGARPDRLRGLFSHRLVGFENRVAPYAIAELRLHQALHSRFGTDIPRQEVRFLTDALENPNEQQRTFGAAYRIIERSHRDANRFKREVPVMVVIGNPPHVENSKGKAPWIEAPRDPWQQPPPVAARPSLDEFRSPNLGRYESDLHGLPWLFWRWAIWKVFEAHPDDTAGVVAFVTPSSFLKGKAFTGMRRHLREVCDEGWIVDISPEGNRPRASTRVFGAKVGRALCISVFARYGRTNARPAVVHHRALDGTRDEKIEELSRLSVDDRRWVRCRDGWQDSYLPHPPSEWDQYPALADLLPWRSRGITTGRAWVYAPDPDLLRRRWEALIAAGPRERRRLFHEGPDRKIDSIVTPLPGRPPGGPLVSEQGPCPDPLRVTFRSFDRQWLIADSRVMERPRASLWAVLSPNQIYISEQDGYAITSGPGLTFSALLPDLHSFMGFGGGGVRPLFRDAAGRSPNVAPGLLDYLATRLGVALSPGDLIAYIAAVVAHPAYTQRFVVELREPGVHVPLTTDRDLWAEAVSIGKRIVWLHTFGHRFADDQAEGVPGEEGLTKHSKIRVRTPIVRTGRDVPDTMSLSSETNELHIGDGVIRPIEEAVWKYDVGGMNVLPHWFDYRTMNPRHKKRSSSLDDINMTRWTAGQTDELLAILVALTECVAMEDTQCELLARVCESSLISIEDLTLAGILPASPSTRRAPNVPDVPMPTLPE